MCVLLYYCFIDNEVIKSEQYFKFLALLCFFIQTKR
uniref:Uncharacterized protein n=1 Tax=Arundo donax TaxID=35708 RepID=A0A0A8YGI2_ARUDO